MARDIGIGLIGVGFMGEQHTRGYRRVRDHFPECSLVPRFVVAADEVEARGVTAIEKLGYERFTTDWHEVISHPDVEAVSITTPNVMHREMALAAAEGGKHFWGEKPLGLYPAETIEIAQATRRSGIVTTIGFSYRHVPTVSRARALIQAGELGEITHYHGRFFCDYGSSPQGALSWRFLRSIAGLGVLGDLMSHVVDMALSLVGPISQVCAQKETFIRRRPTMPMGVGTHFAVINTDELGDVENEDYASSLVKFANGTRGVLETSRVSIGKPWQMAFEVQGSRGALAWDFHNSDKLELRLPGQPGGDTGFTTVFAGPSHGEYGRFQPGAGATIGYDDLKVIEAHQFLTSIAGGEPQEPSVREAAATASVLSAMESSITAGAWEAVDASAG